MEEERFVRESPLEDWVDARTLTKRGNTKENEEGEAVAWQEEVQG